MIDRSALKGLKECAMKGKNWTKIENGDESMLRDGYTMRRSIASMTWRKGIPLELPEEEIDSICENKGLSESLETLRDNVYSISKKFIKVLDESYNIELETSSGIIYNSLEEIVLNANHLEHFHVYSKSEEGEDDIPVLDSHTDA